MRFALAEAGDTLSDSNFTTENADNAVLHVHAEVTYVKVNSCCLLHDFD